MTQGEEITIRDYQDGDGQAIVDLLNEVFGQGDPNYQPRTLAQWRWIYEDNPAGRQVVVAVMPTLSMSTWNSSATTWATLV